MEVDCTPPSDRLEKLREGVHSLATSMSDLVDFYPGLSELRFGCHRPQFYLLSDAFFRFTQIPIWTISIPTSYLTPTLLLE